MTDTSMSFAHRTRRALDFLIIIKGFQNYTPPRSEESIKGFEAFLSKLEETSTEETKCSADYNFKVATRRMKFLQGDDSVMQTFLNVRNYVSSYFGQNSIQHEMLDDIVWKMRTNSYARSKSKSKKDDFRKTRSNTDRSYGTMTGNFADMITYLKGFGEFVPPDHKYSIENMNNYLMELQNINDTVFEALQKKENAKLKRKFFFDELKDRTDRIKSYVKSNYGKNSQEFEKIKNMRF